MATAYFSNIHPWMPVISKTWAYKHLLSSLSPVHADSTLLLLSIELINWIPSTSSADPKTPLYSAVKRFSLELETAGCLTIRTVQAGLLVCLYELGQCIYPAAYISVGACARYAAALGLDKDIKPGNDTAGLPWDQIEERRRTWWAILILDRFINLGNPQRMLATVDPGSGDILPIDDMLWEQGLVPFGAPSTIGSSAELRMGRFARFAEATYLLGQVFRHIADQKRDDNFYEQEGAQLNRTLHALILVAQSEAETRSLEFCTQNAVCYCALLILKYSSLSIAGIRTPVGGCYGYYPTIEPDVVARETARMSQNFLPGGSIPLVEVSPFILHLLYQCCIILSSPSQESRPEDVNSLAILQEALKLLTQRWRASETYLNILAARKSMSGL
ncbi:hypothetical protein F5884DRAFT_794781 [Xylogone sp. PMI_703]|nr:hypothetical protein F5884DRAFT_794781 [Xylogone sp. PMI_703]